MQVYNIRMPNGEYYRKIEQYLAGVEEEKRQRLREETMRQREKADKWVADAREEEPRIREAGSVTLQILRDIEENHPNIKQAPYHDVVTVPREVTAVDGDSQKHAFIRGITYELRWGEKSHVTAEERTLIERFRNSRFHFRRADYPKAIVAESYDVVKVEVNSFVTLQSAHIYQNWGREQFLENPSRIIPYLADALQSPFHVHHALQRKAGYQA